MTLYRQPSMQPMMHTGNVQTEHSEIPPTCIGYYRFKACKLVTADIAVVIVQSAGNILLTSPHVILCVKILPTETALNHVIHINQGRL
jgi:hypothetical protein